MNNILAILKKELTLYFYSPLAYIFISVFLVISGFLFLQNFFLYRQASMQNFFSFLPWILLILVPALCMKLLAEEKKMGTLELILTSPVKDVSLVIGKFKAALIVIAISFLLSVGLAFSINYLGSPDNGVIIAQYISSILLAMVYIAISIFASSLTDNQIIAFILSVTICFVFLIMGQSFVVDALPASIRYVFGFLGISNHFFSMSRGIIDSRDILYYLSLIFFFVFLTLKNLEKRKYE